MPRPPEPVRRLRTEIDHVVLEGLELRASSASRDEIERNRLDLAALRLELSHAVNNATLTRAARAARARYAETAGGPAPPSRASRGLIALRSTA